MMKTSLLCILTIAMLTPGFAQDEKKKRAPASPPAETSITVDGKTISIKYAAPSVKGRKIFGEGGLISKDPTYPVWRAGANSATALHTDVDLDINGLAVPAGDYTLFAVVNEAVWTLCVNKQTKQWGLTYKQENDLGRVKMTMSKPAASIETYKMTLSNSGKKATLQLEWENTIASVPITVK